MSMHKITYNGRYDIKVNQTFKQIKTNIEMIFL